MLCSCLCLISTLYQDIILEDISYFILLKFCIIMSYSFLFHHCSQGRHTPLKQLLPPTLFRNWCPPPLFGKHIFCPTDFFGARSLSVVRSSKNRDHLLKTIPFHIHGPLSQTRETPRPGTEGLQ